jgi:carbon storage regulator
VLQCQLPAQFLPCSYLGRTARLQLSLESRRSSKDKEAIIMLVLSRKVGEKIQIGNTIVVEVRRIAGNRVTLAFRAPRDVRILRGELERAAKEFEAVPVHQESEERNSSVANVAGFGPLVSGQLTFDGMETFSGQEAGREFAV